MSKLEDFRDETWETTEDGRRIIIHQVVGNSGVYLIVHDKETGKLLRDTRPWQMREGLS